MNKDKREEFKKLFFSKRWLATKDKDVVEVACDGLLKWITQYVEEEVRETLKKVEDNLSYAECINPDDELDRGKWFFHIDRGSWIKLKNSLTPEVKEGLKS